MGGLRMRLREWLDRVRRLSGRTVVETVSSTAAREVSESVHSLRSPLLFGQLDVLLCALLGMAAAFAVLLNLPQLARIVFVVPLVLFLPGYVAVAALLPSLDVPAVERFLLSLGTSIALTIATGLAMAAGGVNLGGLDWAAALGSLVVVGAVVAAIRRVRLGLVGPGLSVVRMPWFSALMVLVAALLALDVVLGARVIATAEEIPPPAQLWLVPVDGRPTDARLGMRAGADGGAFRIVLRSRGLDLQAFDVSVGPLQSWERIVSFTPDQRDAPIEARLFAGTSTAASRFVVLEPATNGG